MAHTASIDSTSAFNICSSKSMAGVLQQSGASQVAMHVLKHPRGQKVPNATFNGRMRHTHFLRIAIFKIDRNKACHPCQMASQMLLGWPLPYGHDTCFREKRRQKVRCSSRMVKKAVSCGAVNALLIDSVNQIPSQYKVTSQITALINNAAPYCARLYPIFVVLISGHPNGPIWRVTRWKCAISWSNQCS